jgi:hypothetical protein
VAYLSRGVLLAAVLLGLPAAAGAAPFSVTYEITGGGGFFDSSNRFRVESGTIVVNFPNPGSGSPPLLTMGHSIQLEFVFVYLYQGQPTTVQRIFKPTQFRFGTAFRGLQKTLTAGRGRLTFHNTFQITADADGQMGAGWHDYTTVEGTEDTLVGFRGREISSTPEPRAGLLLALPAILAGTGAIVRAVTQGRRPTSRAA